MSQQFQAKQLSDALSNSIGTLYKLEGFGLVFIFIGTLFLLSALFIGDTITGYIIAALGSLIILVVLYFFYTRDIKSLQKAQVNIQRNKEVIDTFQDAAIHMSDLAYNLHTVTIAHAQEIAEFIIQYQQKIKETSTLLKLLNVPGSAKIGQLADSAYVTRASDLSSSILRITHDTEIAIREIRLSLVSLDITPVKKYLGQIIELDQKLKDLQNTVNSSLQQNKLDEGRK